MKDSDYLENMLKKSHKFKDYTYPSGRVDKIQGYEHYALDELIINEKIDESDIITGCKNVPEIWYNDENNMKRIHFVDIYIPSQNRCIEVKSSWTFAKPNVLLKQSAAKELGYNYEIWVYYKKGNKNCYE
jgi:DNA repair protein RadC